MLEPLIEGLAKLIARDIFALGNEPDSPTIRIEFLGGVDGDEKPQGGLCEKALEIFIAERIDANLRDKLSKF